MGVYSLRVYNMYTMRGVYDGKTGTIDIIK